MLTNSKKWNISQIVCEFAEPKVTQTFWAFEAAKLLQQLRIKQQGLSFQAKQPKNLKLSRQRVKKIIANINIQIVSLEELLSPLNWHKIDPRALSGYMIESPHESQLTQNMGNLFRDWAWGEAENTACLQLLDEIWNPDLKLDKALVLGAGGCRLAYDMHRKMGFAKTHVADFNPLLFLAAEKVIRGHELELVEFPLVPFDSANYSVPRKLSAPESLSDNFNFHLCDIREAKFVPHSFDMVMTPWLIDVLLMDFAEFCALVNNCLCEGGYWVNFGPLGFNNPILSDYYSYEEVKHLVAKAGFEIKDEKYEMIPYLHSPASNHHRWERVLTFRAQKVKTVEEPVIRKSREFYDWELDKDAPVEIAVKEMNLEKGYRFNLQLVKLVDGNRSINQIVKQLALENDIPVDQLDYLATHLLRNLSLTANNPPLRDS